MKGLFIKDFLTLRRKYGPVRIAMDVLLIAVLMIAFGANGAIWVSFVLVPVEAMTMCMTLTNCDEQWKWQKYAFALPVSRAQIVRARYLTAGALAGIGFAASLAVNAAAALAFSAYPPVLHLLLAAASLWLTLFALALVERRAALAAEPFSQFDRFIDRHFSGDVLIPAHFIHRQP